MPRPKSLKPSYCRDKATNRAYVTLNGKRKYLGPPGSYGILVTHPRKGCKTSMALDDLSGGAAYSRFAQTIMWVHRLDKPKSVLVAGPCGNYTTTINRTIRLSKTRNGRGAGMELGYVFEGKSLRFSEQGV